MQSDRGTSLDKQTFEEKGDRKETPDEDVKWQRMIIPIGMAHLGKRWHEKNNELICEVRREHIRAQREQRVHGGRPSPKPPPKLTPSGVKKGNRKKRARIQSASRRSKRTKRTVHRAFFVR